MNSSNSLKSVVLVLAALASITMLAFLYAKTRSVDLRETNEISGLLRKLSDIDSRWNVDVMRAGQEPDANATLPVDRSVDAEADLETLINAARRIGSPELNAGITELAKGIRIKSQLVARFNLEHGRVQQALAELTIHSGELPTQAAQLQVPMTRVKGTLDRLKVAAPAYFMLGQDDQFNVVYSALTELDSAAVGFPAVLREKATRVAEAGRSLLDGKAAEKRLIDQIESLTSGPGLDELAFLLNHELEQSTDEKNIYNVFLITYTGALLVLVAWMGIKIRASNAMLEHRVRERTRELSSAMHQLKESETQLIHSEKLSSLGQMVAGVAHEINTPLAYVKNSLGTVSEKLPAIGSAIDEVEHLLGLLQAGAGANPEQLNQQFALVTQQVSRLKQQNVVAELQGLVKDGVYGTEQMAEIVGNLKDFSRLDRSRVTQFNLNEGLGSTLAMSKHLLKTITVEKQFGDIPFVVCSPTQINQVFLNLITNAAQSLDRGRGKITLRSRKDDDGVAVDVEDTGAGIPADVLPQIFDPFFTTKEVGKGTGLGLSISFKIVKQHGGRIDVNSIPGKGTRFTVHLPLKPPATAGLAV